VKASQDAAEKGGERVCSKQVEAKKSSPGHGPREGGEGVRIWGKRPKNTIGENEGNRDCLKPVHGPGNGKGGVGERTKTHEVHEQSYKRRSLCAGGGMTASSEKKRVTLPATGGGDLPLEDMKIKLHSKTIWLKRKKKANQWGCGGRGGLASR